MLLWCAGNENIHQLTGNKRQMLRVELTDWTGASRHADYDDFTVGSEKTDYRLISLGKYSGNAGQGTTRKHNISLINPVRFINQAINPSIFIPVKHRK